MKKLVMLAALAAIAVGFTGCKSIEVERHAATLATVQNPDGTFSVVRDKDNNPVLLDGGWEVDYINEDNIKFIAFKNPQGRIVSVITLMDGDLQDMRELYLNGITADEYPVKDLLNTYLMDAQYLCRFSPEELREMKAQLQEMGDLNIRGKVNIQLIDTELAMNPNERLKPLMSREEFLDRITEEPEYDEEFEEGEELASKDLDFEEYQYVTVSDEREFILALGSNRTVRIADRTTLNLH